jgi:hypothetical protein
LLTCHICICICTGDEGALEFGFAAEPSRRVSFWRLRKDRDWDHGLKSSWPRIPKRKVPIEGLGGGERDRSETRTRPEASHSQWVEGCWVRERKELGPSAALLERG